VLQRKAASKQKRSKNWEKLQVAVAKLHYHIFNNRKYFHFHNIHKVCDKVEGGRRFRSDGLESPFELSLLPSALCPLPSSILSIVSQYPKSLHRGIQNGITGLTEGNCD
jgi:hypothetical protein